MQLRWATESDAPALAQVLFEAIREGPSPYTEAQRTAWMPHPPDPVRWQARLRQKQTALIACAGRPAGFMTFEDGGCIDLAFVLPSHRGKGIFRVLYTAIETLARQRAEPRLWTFASLSAQAPFQAMGFGVIYHETVSYAGEYLPRAKMEKVLP